VNLFAAPVLLGAGLVSAPAFWAAFVDGTTTPETALVRFMVSALLLWAALAVIGMLVGPPPRPAASTETEAAGAEREAEPAG
jgi:hypothetical protein